MSGEREPELELGRADEAPTVEEEPAGHQDGDRAMDHSLGEIERDYAAPMGALPKQPAGDPKRQVVESNGQMCLVFTSPGGLDKATDPTASDPDVFVFFHGWNAQYNIDPKQPQKGGLLSGSDVIEQAMAHAQGRNLIAVVPQGCSRMPRAAGTCPVSRRWAWRRSWRRCSRRSRRIRGSRAH